ncbi:MAG: alpha/beta-type small acid-soluble spore protein [Bacillota bacterium]|nr:alpha/beta-type small acid-soluble spore protein [Bacillota bacterium]MDD3297515.1 alpha/beta-type small acid-soluble spore protein [Bacillota bacterium]MDD3851081.1 alpha/beta-type small acid-soluble spore protein [Bacillota bacterium]MDD4706911.1 alpha/beta-type small acid-soluble spore protein [Bacillota bacterium]
MGTGGGTTGGNTGTNRTLHPEARQALDRMKFEVASQIGVNLKDGYNGDLTARDAGSIGGFMVKRMIEQVERQMSGK